MGEGAGKGSQYGGAEAGPMSQGTQLSTDVERLPPQFTYEELESQEQGEFTQGDNTSQLQGCVKSKFSSFQAHGSTSCNHSLKLRDPTGPRVAPEGMISGREATLSVNWYWAGPNSFLKQRQGFKPL